MKKHIDILKMYKVKVTPQRLHILELLKKNGHSTIDELFTKLQIKFESISLATVYKNINLFLEVGLLLEVKLHYKKTYYEIVKEKHLHLFCTKCGMLEDIKLPVQVLEEEVKELYKFTSNEMDITFYGNCKKCI